MESSMAKEFRARFRAPRRGTALEGTGHKGYIHDAVGIAATVMNLFGTNRVKGILALSPDGPQKERAQAGRIYVDSSRERIIGLYIIAVQAMGVTQSSD